MKFYLCVSDTEWYNYLRMVNPEDINFWQPGGTLTVTEEYRFEVSSRIKAEFENGREYYSYHGKELKILPASAADIPSGEYLGWHNENVYRG